VENFSKYYEGNGRPFRPLRSVRRYTLPVGPATAARASAPPPLPSAAATG